jgi:hypothetical protein
MDLVSGYIMAESLCRNQCTFVTVKVQVLVIILFSVLFSFILFLWIQSMEYWDAVSEKKKKSNNKKIQNM